MRERRDGEARRHQLSRGVHGAPACLSLLGAAARSARCSSNNVRRRPDGSAGRELLTSPAASPRKHQKQHRRAGLTSCSTPGAQGSAERLELLLLLKADMLQGQTEFNQKSSGALRPSAPTEGLQDGRARFLACFRRAGLHRMSPSRSSSEGAGAPLHRPELPPLVSARPSPLSRCEGDAQQRRTPRGVAREEVGGERGRGEVRKQLSLARSLSPSLSKQVWLEINCSYQRGNSLSAHVSSLFTVLVPNLSLKAPPQRAEISGEQKETC